jgi:hypothetical protein
MCEYGRRASIGRAPREIQENGLAADAGQVHWKRSASMATRQLAAPSASSVSAATAEPLQSERLRAALAELLDLLESYAPMWYTEDHHNRALGALLALDSPIRAKPKEAVRGELTEA